MSKLLSFTPVILAAGRGTRMNSPLPKVLCTVGGQPILALTLETLTKISSHPPIVVIPPNSAEIKALVLKFDAVPTTQYSPEGSAKSLASAISSQHISTKYTLVLNGDDSFLYEPETLREFIGNHDQKDLDVSFITVSPIQPYPDVRKVIRNPINHNFSGLEKTENSNEIVCGCYLYKTSWVRKHISQITPSPINHEYHIVDLLLIAVATRAKIETYTLKDPGQWWGVNTQADLILARQLWKQRH